MPLMPNKINCGFNQFIVYVRNFFFLLKYLNFEISEMNFKKKTFILL